MLDNPLHILMSPKSIATVGASNNPLKMGTIQTTNLINSGFRGKIYPIHPKEKTVLGHQAYRAVADLPETPDIAFLVVPTDQVVPLMEEFGKIGTRRAVIVTAGFKEKGAEGKRREEELAAVAGKYGIRFLGPNCIGIINSQASLNMTLAPQVGKPGMLSFASQSGTYVAQTFSYLNRSGIRFCKAISLGNETNIDSVDALEYLGEDEDTKAIILYIEGIRDGRRFVEVARKITPHKPVLALYAGGSDAGARSGMSHTGAMAGPDYLYEGIFKQAGVIRVQTIEELYSHGWALATQPPLQGNRLGVITNSGGPGTSIANTANMAGMDIPCFSNSLQKEIRELLTGHAASCNPVDLTFQVGVSAMSTTLPEMIMKSGEVDALIVHGVFVFHEQNLFDLSRSVSLPHTYGKPMLATSFFDRQDAHVAFYQDHDIPVFEMPEKAARAMADLLRYRKVRERKAIETPALPEPAQEALKIIKSALKNGQKGLDEYESKKILAAYGIPVCREKLAATGDEALAAAREIGFPVALKGCSWEITHKTEKKLVCLGLQKEKEVTDSFQAIREEARKNIPVLVQEMIPGSREFAMGMTRFPGFGPVLLFGLGGIFTEALQDNSFRLAPLSLTEAAEMVYDIRADKMLMEFRGMPAVDVPALADILQQLSFISLLHPEIAEMDLNPLIITGARPIVADALVILKA